MTTRIDPPSLDSSPYELYRQELLAWREVTDIRMEKQGIVIALSLPKEHKSQIREKVFDQISLVDLKQEDGLDILLRFLDEHLKKDDLADSFEKFEDFEDFRRRDTMSISEYISSFDSRYRKIHKLKMTLPSEILAFKLLKNSNISKEERLLVLTGMNFENKDTLYDQAKKSLKKFKGGEPVPKDTRADYPVMFTGYNKSDIAQLGMHARNCAVLDSACSSIVCGEMWLNYYLDSLCVGDRNRVRKAVGQKTFRFGGGECLHSIGEYILPVMVAGKEVSIKTDVVQSDIPLLLSRDAMKRASVRLNMETDTVNMFGKEIALNITNSGHYCIPIDKVEKITVADVLRVSDRLDSMNRKDKYWQLLKLHRQFAHPTWKKLRALLQDIGKWKDDYACLLKEIGTNCDICQQYEKVRAADEIYEHGDVVYYRRDGTGWIGPATVMFQHAEVVLVKYSGIFVRVSLNRLRKKKEYWKI